MSFDWQRFVALLISFYDKLSEPAKTFSRLVGYFRRVVVIDRRVVKAQILRLTCAGVCVFARRCMPVRMGVCAGVQAYASACACRRAGT